MEKLILEKLDDQADRLHKIERAISVIAVQDERILNMQSQLNSLWKKYDSAFSPEGMVSKIKQHQASCPRETIDKTLKRQDTMIKVQWSVIGLLVMIVAGKVIGAF
jgi:hypothetical protein